LGYQLWKSETTGHQRRGTRFGELRALFEDGITVAAICEEIQSCLRGDDAETAREFLRQLDFDVAGVQDEHDGPVTGYVLREELGPGRIGDFTQSLTPRDLISDSTPLADLLNLLRDRDHAFVLRRSDVAGIVNRADLNKPPVRIFLFGLISMFEMHVGSWCQKFYPNDSWKTALTNGRLEKAIDLRTLRTQKNQDTGLFDCLQFSDKCELLLRNEELTGHFEISSKAKARTTFSKAQDLRNSLAHSASDITNGSDWESVIDLVGEVERIVQRSDHLLECGIGGAS
jgi:hypothetical protein